MPTTEGYKKRATAAEVARKAGVSTATVSRVTNGSAYVRPEVANRVRDACRELNYSPNGLARNVARGRSNTIGVLLGDIESPFYLEALRGIEATASKHGRLLLLMNSNRRPELERDFLAVIEEQRVAGLIITTGPECDSKLRAMADQGVPSVLITRRMRPSHSRIHSVTLDNERAGMLAAEHLLDQGARRIVVVTGPETLATQRERAKGAEAALERRGIATDLRVVHCAVSSARAAEEILLREFRDRDVPDGVFMTSGLLSLGAYAAAAQLQLAIPNDLAVVGFDDFASANYLAPSLARVTQPARLMGQTAAALLLRELERPYQRPRQRRFSPDFVSGGSCGDTDASLRRENHDALHSV